MVHRRRNPPGASGGVLSPRAPVGRPDVPRCPGCGRAAHASETDDDGYHPQCRPGELHDNPGPIEVDGEAIDKYREFHRFDPKKIIEHPELVIPARLRHAGAAKHVMYRSNKVDPATMQKPRGTFDYIHEHDAGVKTFIAEGAADTDVPAKFRPDPATDPAFVVLGKCLGFAYTDRDGDLCEAEGTHPLPDLLCTPDGKCLLVVQSGKKVLAMMWGGALGVFARGIDG